MQQHSAALLLANAEPQRRVGWLARLLRLLSATWACRSTVGAGLDRMLGVTNIINRHAMRTLTRDYLGGEKVAEDRFKVDLAVLDRYQSFTTEVLRLALLGLAGYGFLITNVVFQKLPNSDLRYLKALADNQWLWAGGIAVLGISAASALAHRYYSSDCLTHFVRRVRLTEYTISCPAIEKVSIDTKIQNEEQSLAEDLRMCHFTLATTCGTLGLGICLFAAACVRTIFA